MTINVAAGKKGEARVLFSNGESSATLVVYRENISCDQTIKEVSTNGEEFSVNIETHASWTAVSDKSWVTITPESGHGDATVNINVSSGSYDGACVTFSCATSSAKLIIYRGCDASMFSVSASKQVQFSQGNLQYRASTQTWRFAGHQYDMIGSANSNIANNYSGWIDLFGWGTGVYPTNKSTNDSYYSTFTDWGVNAISNGGNKANQWRTLTKDEWVYLFTTRTNASGKYGQATVAGVHGVIVLPDVYVGTAINTDHSAWDNNTISAYDWLSYEAKGAVFLPAAGDRYGTGVYDVGSYGYYWSSTPGGTNYAYYLYFYSGSLNPQDYGSRYYGLSVRLVR